MGPGITDNHVCGPVCFLQSSEWAKKTLFEMEIVVVLVVWDNDAESNVRTRNAEGWEVRRDPGAEQPQAARQEYGRINSPAGR